MPRSVVCVVALALGLSGCFRAHELAEVDAGVDAAARPDAVRPDAIVLDVGHPDDAFTPDAFALDASVCARPAVGTPRHACVLAATGALPADEPYTLPLTFTRCECPQTRSCSVAIVGDHISLTTAVCEDPVACTECEFDVGCDLPPLPVGHYFVDVNGARTMELDARPRIVPLVARPVCAPIPAVPDSALVCDLDLRPAPSRPLTVCRPSLEDVGRYVRFEVVVGCASCFDADGGCETQLDGERLVLRPHHHRCDCPDCGACEPVCTPLTIACVSPPLSSGVYEVVVVASDGEHAAGPLEIRDVFDPGDPICTEIP